MEIITVQIGNYASFVGTHFWNLQEKSSPDEINQSVLFSENSDHIWTPRLLLIDLKDSFGTLGLQNSNIKRNGNYTASACLWDSKIDKVDIEPLPKNSFIRALDDAYDQFIINANAPILKKEKLLEEVEKEIINLSFHCQGLPSEYKRIDELKKRKEELATDINRMKKRLIEDLDLDEEIEKNTFLDLDNSEYWSDYLKAYLSPRSLFEFGSFSHRDPNIAFDCFPNGHLLFKKEEDKEEIEDKFHWLIEGCDQLQGIQLMLDVDTAFGAIGVDFIEMVKDEFPKSPIQLYSFYGEAKQEKSQNEKRLLNMGLSFAHLSEMCSIYTPLSYKHFKANPTARFNNWNLERNNWYQTSALFAAGIDMVTKPARTIGAQFASLNSIVSTMTEIPQRNICSLEISLPFPGSDIANLFDPNKYPFASSPFLFPLTPNMSKDSSVNPYSSILSLAGVDNQSTRRYMNLSPKEMLSNYCPSSRKQCFSYEKPYTLPLSFPKLFHERSVDSVQSLVHLQNTQQQYYNIKLLVDALSKIDISKHHEYQLNNIEHQKNIETIAKKSDFYAKKNFD